MSRRAAMADWHPEPRIWLGVLGCGAFVDECQVKGSVVATPAGRGVVLADVVIDATGKVVK